jgi:hypothetical protein
LRFVAPCTFYRQDLYKHYTTCDKCPLPVQQLAQYLNCV